MGIRFYCPNGHKLNVKAFQAGRRGICPFCGAKIQIPLQSTRRSSKEERSERRRAGAASGVTPAAGQPASGGAVATEPTRPSATAATSSPDPGATLSAPTPAPAGPSAVSTSARPWPAPGTLAATGPATAGVATPASPGAAPGNQPALGPQASHPVAASQAATAITGIAPAAGLTAAVPQGGPGGPADPQPATLAVPDPLAEAGNVVWYVRPPSGGQFGPATADIMRNWIAEGRISADTLVWREGWRDWQEAREVFPQLGPAMASLTPLLGASRATPASAAGRPARRTSSTGTQIALLTGLILVVIALLAVFVWVLFGGPAESNTAGAAAGGVWFSPVPWGKLRRAKLCAAMRHDAER